MAIRQDNGRTAPGKSPVLTLESVADLARATIQVRPDAGVGGIELRLDGRRHLLLSPPAAAALAAALREALVTIEAGGRP